MKKQSRRTQRALERELFGPEPKPMRRRTRTRLPRAQQEAASTRAGDCPYCGNRCDPVDDWTCPHCGVVYPGRGYGRSTGKKRVFEYLLLLRPASFSTVPSGFVGLRKSENPKYPHGVVQYEKPLRKSDIEAFDLMPLDPLDPVNLRRVRDAWREHVMSRFVEGGREMFNIEDEEIQGFRILTMSTRPGVEYQMTRFQRMGPRGKGRPEPTGHMDFNDFGEAADAMLTRAARRKLVEELVPRA